MRLLILILIASAAYGQCGSVGKLVFNPISDQFDCTAVAGAGTGSVTSIDLLGTADQITVTGSSPITTSGSWTLSFPAVGVTLPGTTTIANASPGILLGNGNNSAKFVPVDPPTAPTAALVATGTGNVTNGAHVWLVTFVTATGETAAGAASNSVTVDGSHKQVDLTSIPVGPAGVTARKVYQLTANSSLGPQDGNNVLDYEYVKLLTTINDNTTTIYTANTIDGSLGATPPYDSTAGGIYWNSSLVARVDSFGLNTSNLVLDRNGVVYLDTSLVPGAPMQRTSVINFCCATGAGANMFFGTRAGPLQHSGSYTGSKNGTFGSGSMQALTSGERNNGHGDANLYQVTTGSRNSGFGDRVGANCTTCSNGIFIGAAADLTSVARQWDGVVVIGKDAKADNTGAVSIGLGITNAVANSVNIGTNSTIYLSLPGVPGSNSQAACWKTTTQLSYCEDVVGVTGACTCH